MSDPLIFSVDQIMPSLTEMKEALGIPKDKPLKPKHTRLIESALERLKLHATPKAIIRPIEKGNFFEILKGESFNEEQLPVNEIAPRADRVALYAVTLGEEISKESKRLHADQDWANYQALDCASSIAVERLVAVVENYFKNQSVDNPNSVLAYNPGYCGWHTSGQKKLIQSLDPSKIGIQINDSYMLSPVKSTSGVLIEGERKIHIFKNKFSYCKQCISRSCRDRILSLSKPTPLEQGSHHGTA